MVNLSRQFLAGSDLESRHPSQSHRHLAGTSGRAFKLCSTRQNVVVRISSVSQLFPIMAWMTCLKLLTRRSQTLPWCGARWVDFLLDAFFNQSFRQNLLISSEHVVRQFFFAGNKVCPLVGPDDGWNASPGDEINLSMPITQLLVSIEDTASKWTARVVENVQGNPQRFSVDRFTYT